jgi:hypothetical protein
LLGASARVGSRCLPRHETELCPDIGSEPRFRERPTDETELCPDIGSEPRFREWPPDETECLADHVLGARLHVSYGDTISDLAADAFVAALGGIIMVLWDSYGCATRRRVPGRLLDR